MAVLVLIVLSCSRIMPKAIEPNEAMDAPLEGLSNEQRKFFFEGAEEFEEVYTRETGLGPIYVSSSCASCHSGANRGHVFTTLTRFGQSDTTGNHFLALGAPQIQHQFIPGFIGEEIPDGATSTHLIAPIVAGNGFLELVPEQDLISMADPNDLNGDGISGRINWNTIPSWVLPHPQSISQNGKYICRFGKKAATYNLHQQVVQAFNQDMGITTTFLPLNPFNYKTGMQVIPSGTPDITDENLNATIFYIQTLQTPLRRNADNPHVQHGKLVFDQVGCSSCHKEKLHTGFSYVQALSDKDFYPYTDLLLHDMGPELDDHYTEGTALTNEWRTEPLWGLGLAEKSQGKQYFLMHDGRARSIEEAIEMHGGEGVKSRDNYLQLTVSDKEDLIQFLKSL